MLEISSDMSMLRCSEDRAMLMRDLILTAGLSSVPTAAVELTKASEDVIVIGSRNVKMVWDQ